MVTLVIREVKKKPGSLIQEPRFNNRSYSTYLPNTVSVAFLRE